MKALMQTIRFIAFDFDGVFTDDKVYVLEDGSEAVRCFRGDGLGLRKLERLGIETAIVSTESNPVVSARARKLKIRCVQDCQDKRQALDALVKSLGITLAETAFVGNDSNDLTCLRSVGLPIIVHNAHPDVVPYALYRTKASGGQGAVREVCDWFEVALTEGARQSSGL